MALKTTSEQLEEVQTAILSVCNAQSYTIDGRTFTKANLNELSAREELLLKRYYNEQGTSPRVSFAQFSDMAAQ